MRHVEQSSPEAVRLQGAQGGCGSQPPLPGLCSGSAADMQVLSPLSNNARESTALPLELQPTQRPAAPQLVRCASCCQSFPHQSQCHTFDPAKSAARLLHAHTPGLSLTPKHTKATCRQMLRQDQHTHTKTTGRCASGSGLRRHPA